MCITIHVTRDRSICRGSPKLKCTHLLLLPIAGRTMHWRSCTKRTFLLCDASNFGRICANVGSLSSLYTMRSYSLSECTTLHTQQAIEHTRASSSVLSMAVTKYGGALDSKQKRRAACGLPASARCVRRAPACRRGSMANSCVPIRPSSDAKFCELSLEDNVVLPFKTVSQLLVVPAPHNFFNSILSPLFCSFWPFPCDSCKKRRNPCPVDS